MTAAARFLVTISFLLSSWQPLAAENFPVTSWQPQWKAPFCEMSTGDPKDLSMSLWAVPGSNGVEIYLSGARAPRTTNMSDVQVELTPSNERFLAHARWDGFSWRGFLHLVVVQGRGFVDKFASSRGLAVRDSEKLVPISYEGAGEAMRAFRQCLDSHEREWGVDPSADAALKVRPELISGTWVTGEDYPPNDVEMRQNGIVVVRLTTDETGKVTSCVIVHSIASKSMEDLTCRLALKRARFKIAIGTDNHPTRATFITYLNFRIIQ